MLLGKSKSISLSINVLTLDPFRRRSPWQQQQMVLSMRYHDTHEIHTQILAPYHHTGQCSFLVTSFNELSVIDMLSFAQEIDSPVAAAVPTRMRQPMSF